MGTKAICTTLVVICIILKTFAQQPGFPHPDKSKNIPFGKKTAAPSFNDDRDNKLFQALYPGAEKLKNIDEIIALNKKSTPHLFNDPNSFIRQHLANRDASITKTKKSPNGVGSSFHLTGDINPFAESDPGNIGFYLSALDWVYPVLNDVSYSEGDDGVHGRELLRSDGTAAGTYLVKDINPGEASTLIRNMTAIANKVYFSASTDGFTYHPWVTDGTESGTQMLNIVDSGWSYSPQQFIEVQNMVYFIADGNAYRSAIWKTDGTAAGTSLSAEVGYIDYYGTDIQQVTAVNGLLFFTFYSVSYGRQVWRSDGTQAGTYITKPVNVFDYAANVPMQLTAYNNKLYFSADDGTGRKLWVSDGTWDGTTYAPGQNDILMQPDYLQWDHTQPFPVLNNVLYLSGFTYADGNGLYKYDASTNDGLVLVKDITSAVEPMFIVPGESRIVNNKLYMKVISSIGDWHDELWSTTGDAASTQLVKSFAGEPGSYMINLKSGYGILYFVKYDIVYGSELWKSDGTPGGTAIVKDINAGPQNSQPWYMTECNGKVLFSLHESKTGAELWSTNGSSANTLLVKDINTTATQSSWAGTFYNGIIATKNGVLFGAFEPGTGGELYKSDGTAIGTQLINEITAGQDWSYPNSFIEKKGTYYFIGDNPAGTAIYKTDGTKNGLKKITTDIDRNIYSVTKFDIADNGKLFYVLSNHFTSSYELWTSDGTSPGTILLSAFVSFNPTMITNGNYAFFAAGDFEHGYELWKSDGTIAGTQIVKDINQGPDGSYPYSFIAYNGSIYFGAYDNSYIYTCWKSDGTEIGTFKIANIQLPFTFKNDGLNSYACISNKALYLSVFSNETFQVSLWKTNGAISTTSQVSTELFYPYSLADVEGTLFFNAYNSFFEGGLWKLGPNAANPEFINPGIFSQFPASSCGKLYFVSNDMLWSSDGTSSGTTSVSDPFLSGLNSFTGLTGSNNKLFFSATSYQTGFELFVGNTCSSSTEVHSAQRSSSNLAQVGEKPINFEIYPNPATEIISVVFNSKNTSNEKIIVTDITGRLLFDKNVTVKKGNNIISVSVKSLPTGTYFIKLSGKKEQIKQFVKLY